MLMTGTDLLDASLLTAAIGFGLMAVGAGGGIRSVPGLLNFVMILKFLLIGVFLKVITFQAADSNLNAPRTTAEVMAVGFFALYIGTLIFRHTIKIKGLVHGVTDSKMYLCLTIVFSIACLGSTLVILMFAVSYETALTGGFWGVAHQFEIAGAFCVIPAMYYAWSSGSKRFLSHPLVVAIFVVEVMIGIASTTKQGIMEPVLCYLGVGFIRYGIKSKAVWGLVAAGAFFYVSLIYPYSQYVRNHGGRDGTLQERLETIQEVFFNVASDADFRQAVDSQISTGDTYLGKDSFRPISRFAMIGEADRLIAATDATQSYTGWDTISLGFRAAGTEFYIGRQTDGERRQFFGAHCGRPGARRFEYADFLRFYGKSVQRLGTLWSAVRHDYFRSCFLLRDQDMVRGIGAHVRAMGIKHLVSVFGRVI